MDVGEVFVVGGTEVVLEVEAQVGVVGYAQVAAQFGDAEGGR